MSDVGEPRSFSEAWSEHGPLWDREHGPLSFDALHDLLMLEVQEWERLKNRTAWLRGEDGTK